MNSVKENNSWIELNKEKSQNISVEFSEDSKSNRSLDKIRRNLEKDLTNNFTTEKSLGISNLNMSYFTSSKAPNVSCKLHAKEYLIVDVLKFKIHCSKCIEKGDKNSFLELKGNESDEEEEFECSSHPNSKGLFYCDDCQVFICKLCFANEHRSHKSNLPSDIAISYKESLKEVVENISNIRPRIDESLKSISDIDKKIKLIRESSISGMKLLVSKINSIIKAKYDQSFLQYVNLFEGIDSEVENVYKRLESLQKKSNKFIFELNEILKYITSSNIKENVDICTFKMGKHHINLEILKMLEDSKNFLNFKIENTNIKANNKIKDFIELSEKFMKNVKIYEGSVLNSINTGISSSSLRLRRYSKFFKKIYQYYKTSSLICKVNSPICVVGFGLCGLHQTMTNEKYKSEENTPQKITRSIPIQIEVSEIKSEGKKQSLIKEKHNLNLISNSNDPVIVLYLNKAIVLKSEGKYLITITNLHKESFLEIWCGEVAKVFLKNMTQFIHCNTSRINFEFESAEGEESDFNEFNSGIIADLIYSNLV